MLQFPNPWPVVIQRNALPFRNDDEGKALRDRVDAAITTLKENGTLTEISQKWFGTDITR